MPPPEAEDALVVTERKDEASRDADGVAGHEVDLLLGFRF